MGVAKPRSGKDDRVDGLTPRVHRLCRVSHCAMRHDNPLAAILTASGLSCRMAQWDTRHSRWTRGQAIDPVIPPHCAVWQHPSSPLRSAADP